MFGFVMDQTLRETRAWHTAQVTMDALVSDSFDCPRCGTSVSQRFYGPCESCCVALRAKFPGIGRDMTAAEYVPKMNVTPNAVALKDD